MDTSSTLRTLSGLVWVAVVVLLGYVALTRWTAPVTPATTPPSSTLAAASAFPSPSAAPGATEPAQAGLPASPGPGVQERVDYYDVWGTTASELRRATDLLGPQKRPEEGTGRAAAYTDWTVHWRWQLESSSRGGPCALKSFVTSVEIVTTMPRWPGHVEGTPLARSWDRYVEALARHEREHAENGIRAGRAIQGQVSALPPVPTCREMEDAIKAQADAIVARYHEADVEYDRQTQHGVKQGVVFPTDEP